MSREVVKKIGFSFYPEDLENLETVAKDLGMSKTEVMRQLIKKALGDKKTREIIAKNSFWEKVNRHKELTSYNVHSDKQKKDDATDHTAAPVVSSNNQDYYNFFFVQYKAYRMQSEQPQKAYYSVVNSPVYPKTISTEKNHEYWSKAEDELQKLWENENERPF